MPSSGELEHLDPPVAWSKKICWIKQNISNPPLKYIFVGHMYIYIHDYICIYIIYVYTLIRNCEFLAVSMHFDVKQIRSCVLSFVNLLEMVLAFLVFLLPWFWGQVFSQIHLYVLHLCLCCSHIVLFPWISFHAIFIDIFAPGCAKLTRLRMQRSLPEREMIWNAQAYSSLVMSCINCSNFV